MPDFYIGQNIDFTQQHPLYAFIEVSLAGVTVSDFGNQEYPDCVMSLTVNRRSVGTANTAGDDFELSLFDETAIRIEELIYQMTSSGGDKSGAQCHIKYGWANSSGEVTGSSREFDGIIYKYSLNFEGPSTSLTCAGISIGLSQALTTAVETFPGNEYKGNPAKIVEAICGKIGLPVGKIEPTKDTPLSTEGEYKTFNCTSQTYMSFIQKYLCPIAVPAGKDIAGYEFYVDNGKAYFIQRPVGADSIPSLMGATGLVSQISNVIRAISSGSMSIGNIISGLLGGSSNPVAKAVTQMVNGIVSVSGNSKSVRVSTGNSSLSSGSSSRQSEGNVILLGDSQMNILHDLTNSSGRKGVDSMNIQDDRGDYWNTDSGLSFQELREMVTSWTSGDITSYLKKTLVPGSVVGIKLGHVDPYNIQGYKSLLTQLRNALARENCVLGICSVDPVEVEGRTVKTDSIEDFNEMLKSLSLGSDGRQLSSCVYLDTYGTKRALLNEKKSLQQQKSAAELALRNLDRTRTDYEEIRADLERQILEASDRLAEIDNQFTSIANKTLSDIEDLRRTVTTQDRISTEGIELTFKKFADEVDKAPGHTTRYYEYYSGKQNNQVISFSPEWSDQCVAGVGPGAAGATVSVEPISHEINQNVVQSGAIRNYGIMGKSSSDYQVLERSAMNLWSKCYGKPNQASMEIMGDPGISLTNKVGVAVYTKYGILHHTSGVYLVNSISDNISNGVFITTLDMMKLPNESLAGVTDYWGSGFEDTMLKDAGTVLNLKISGTGGDNDPLKGYTPLNDGLRDKSHGKLYLGSDGKVYELVVFGQTGSGKLQQVSGVIADANTKSAYREIKTNSGSISDKYYLNPADQKIYQRQGNSWSVTGYMLDQIKSGKVK